MIYTLLFAGLGNRLFQLAMIFSYAKKHNIDYRLVVDYANTHSKQNYFTSIFKNHANKVAINIPKYRCIEKYEDCFRYVDYPLMDDLMFKGYFQCEKYIKDYKKEFIDSLCFDEAVTNRYPNLDNSMFIHIRGGDYLRIKLHHVDLKHYYNKAILYASRVYNNCNFYVFTDDVNYAKTLVGTDYKIIQEDEVATLFLMSRCRLGGICANSSFSWWGAYLNDNPTKLVIMPNKWINDNREIDIYPENSLVMDIVN